MGTSARTPSHSNQRSPTTSCGDRHGDGALPYMSRASSTLGFCVGVQLHVNTHRDTSHKTHHITQDTQYTHMTHNTQHTSSTSHQKLHTHHITSRHKSDTHGEAHRIIRHITHHVTLAGERGTRRLEDGGWRGERKKGEKKREEVEVASLFRTGSCFILVVPTHTSTCHDIVSRSLLSWQKTNFGGNAWRSRSGRSGELRARKSEATSACTRAQARTTSCRCWCPFTITFQMGSSTPHREADTASTVWSNNFG